MRAKKYFPGGVPYSASGSDPIGRSASVFSTSAPGLCSWLAGRDLIMLRDPSPWAVSRTLIAFSAQPGAVAEDGDGRNSPYTGALLAHIDRPGLTLPQVFQRVGRDVEKATARRQSPREFSSLRGDFFFVPGTPEGIAKSRRIAVVEFLARGIQDDPEIGWKVAELLISPLQRSGVFVVREQALLRRVLDEQVLSKSDYVDERKRANEAGRVYSVGAIVTGTVFPLGSELHVEARLVDSTTARLLWSGSAEVGLQHRNRLDERLAELAGRLAAQYAGDPQKATTVASSPVPPKIVPKEVAIPPTTAEAKPTPYSGPRNMTAVDETNHAA